MNKLITLFSIIVEFLIWSLREIYCASWLTVLCFNKDYFFKAEVGQNHSNRVGFGIDFSNWKLFGTNGLITPLSVCIINFCRKFQTADLNVCTYDNWGNCSWLSRCVSIGRALKANYMKLYPGCVVVVHTRKEKFVLCFKSFYISVVLKTKNHNLTRIRNAWPNISSQIGPPSFWIEREI